jgi:hypothetical protein
MWASLSARLRLWLLLAIGAPVLTWLLGAIGHRLEARSGPTSTSRALNLDPPTNDVRWWRVNEESAS